MTALLAVALAAALNARPAAAQDAPSDHWDARVTAVTGDVVVHPADGGEESAAEPDMPLEEGDRIVTSAGATAEISLDGGSLIALQENSDFTLEQTKKAQSVFALSFGSLLAKIEHLGDQRLSVKTPTSVAAVRGTEFGVDAEQDGATHVGVFEEGRVEVKGESGETQTLAPNQETSVARGRGPLRPFALRRFAARRARMRAQIRRLAAVRRNWRPIAAEQRRARRQEFLQRLRQRRREMMQKRQGRGRERNERRREQIERERERRRPGGRQRRRARPGQPPRGQRQPQQGRRQGPQRGAQERRR